MASRDVLFIGVIIFVLALAFFVANFVLNTTINGMIGTTAINSSARAVHTLQGAQSLTAKFDYVVLAVFIALTIALFITGWFIGGIPIFMAIYFIVIILATMVGGILASIWTRVSTASVFGTTIASFPITDHLITNLHIYIAVVGCVGLVVMFAKPSIEGGAP